MFLKLEHKNESAFVLNKSLTFFMAVICGVTVANLYYIQPLEAQIATTFHVSENAVGIAVMLTQIGYALGLLLFVPLGDITDRRTMIFRMLLIVAVALIATGWSPTYEVMLIATFTVGLTTIIPQLIVPYAAQLAQPKEQGKVIGKVMSGLLVGVLLSRTFSGVVGSITGWRTVYFIAACLTFLLAFIIHYTFPKTKLKIKMSYYKLLKSIPALIKTQHHLREASCNGFFMFGSFSIFWTSLVFFLETPYFHMGAREAGLLGLTGIAGAIAAPQIGKWADRIGPYFTVRIGILLSTFAYICFLIFGFHILGLIAGAIILNIGNQFAQVSNMTLIQSINDEIRSRNQAVFMFFYFIGGSLGSFLGTLCFQYFGWYGVCGIGLVFQITAIILYFYV